MRLLLLLLLPIVQLFEGAACDRCSAFRGTGFAIEGGYVLTNAHVVSTPAPVWYPGGDPLRVVRQDADLDLALLDAADSGRAYIELADEVPPPGSTVHVIGARRGGFELRTGTIRELHRDYIVSSMEAPRGFSGSPLLNEQGKLIGVTVGALPDGSSVAVRLERIKAFLQ